MATKAARLPMLLSRSSPEPLYRQLAAHLEDAVRNGTLKHGERIEAEGLLALRFGVSRITVRQAVEDLVRKQILVRKQGKGTFVTSPAVRHDLRRLHGLLGSLFSQAEGASARLLRYELAATPSDVAEQFGLEAGEPGLALDRLYLIEGRPVAFVHAWLASEIARLPHATSDLISTEQMMREAGIRIASSQVSLRAEAAGAKVGGLLKISARAPVLVLRRKATGDDGRVKEVGRCWFCSDGYEFVCSAESATEGMFAIRNVEEQA